MCKIRKGFLLQFSYFYFYFFFKLVDRFHKYGICLSKSMKYTIQEEIGKHFLDGAVQLLQEGRTFVFVLDNIDWDIKVHDMRSENQNKSVHAVATSVVFDRVTSSHLPNDGPKRNLANCDLKCLLIPTDEEKRSTRERYKIFIGRILCEAFPSFNFLKEVIPVHTPCQYQAEMSSKSVVIPLPVLMKDEKKYSDVVDVLDQQQIGRVVAVGTLRLTCFKKTATRTLKSRSKLWVRTRQTRQLTVQADHLGEKELQLRTLIIKLTEGSNFLPTRINPQL